MKLFRAPSIEAQALGAIAQTQNTNYHFHKQMAHPGMDPAMAHDKARRHLIYAEAYWIYVPACFLIGSFLYLKAMERGNLISLEATVAGAALFFTTLALTVRRRQWLKSRADEQLVYRISSPAMVWIWIGLVVLAPMTFVGAAMFQGILKGEPAFKFTADAPSGYATPDELNGSTYGTPEWKGCDYGCVEQTTPTTTVDTAPYVPYTPPTTQYVAPSTYSYQPPTQQAPVESDRPTYESRYGLG